MVKQVTERMRQKLRKATHRKPKPDISEQEDEILRAATLELVTRHGGHFVATGLRETRIKGIRVWIITVTLRYTTGFGGYVSPALGPGQLVAADAGKPGGPGGAAAEVKNLSQRWYFSPALPCHHPATSISTFIRSRKRWCPCLGKGFSFSLP